MKYALIGEAGAGKDTVAFFLEGYQRTAFGDELRSVCKALRWPGPDHALAITKSMSVFMDDKHIHKFMEFAALEPVGNKDRRLLQDLGTYCREIDDGIWIRPVIKEVLTWETHGIKNFVVTDVRRKSELDALVKIGFWPVYVWASEHIRTARLRDRDGGEVQNLNHTAEKEIKKLFPYCKILIDNDHQDMDRLGQTVREKLLFQEPAEVIAA